MFIYKRITISHSTEFSLYGMYMRSIHMPACRCILVWQEASRAGTKIAYTDAYMFPPNFVNMWS